MTEQTPTLKDLEVLYNLNKQLETRLAKLEVSINRLEAKVARLDQPQHQAIIEQPRQGQASSLDDVEGRLQFLEDLVAYIDHNMPRTGLLNQHLLVRVLTVMGYVAFGLLILSVLPNLLNQPTLVCAGIIIIAALIGWGVDVHDRRRMFPRKEEMMNRRDPRW